MTETNSQDLNPIADADFEAIDRLFNKDPQFLTEEDISLIVQKLRSGRGKCCMNLRRKPQQRKS